MSVDDPVSRHPNAKANLEHIYNRPDPRAYFRELRRLDYATPSAGKPLFLSLISTLEHLRDGSVCVLDLGCSYGVNGALLKQDMTMEQLYDHWAEDRFQGASPDEVLEHDRRYFADRDAPHDFEVIGLDRAERAVAFAEEIGLIDQGMAADLEADPLPDSALPEPAAVDLMATDRLHRLRHENDLRATAAGGDPGPCAVGGQLRAPALGFRTHRGSALQLRICH